QVSENFEKYGKYHKLNMALLIGGTNMADQIKKLEKGVDVLIATPGRLLDHFERGKLLLTGVELLVIDEADRMLDMGFIPDIEEICTKLPANRQTLLFSATMPGPIKKLADKFLTGPKTIEVARPATANVSIDQRVLKVDSRRKKQVLTDRLKGNDVRTAIVFCNRKTTVRELMQSLKRSGLNAGEIHGDMEQPERIRELDRFKSGEINILVASDVAARGLDIKDVSHVFNYDVPWHPDDYIHRIGRTGRAGKTGIAITLATAADAEAIDAIEKLTGAKIRPVEGGSAPPDESAPPEGEEEERPRRERGARAPRGRGRSEEPKREPRPRRRAEPEAKPEAEPESRSEAEPEAPPEPKPAARRSEPRRERPEAEPRARREEPRREPRPARGRSEPRPEPAPAQDEEGWNGPVPSFLAHKLG
ncbi:MAG TPA: DEAD/DEAH box helicase, partial [Allosphingosinicella sp.]